VSIIRGRVGLAGIRAGSRIPRVGTRHMIIQLTAPAIFILDLAVGWSDRKLDKADPLWLVLDAIGLLTVLLGGDVGASMVFRMGYRVQDSDRPAGQTLAPDQVRSE